MFEASPPPDAAGSSTRIPASALQPPAKSAELAETGFLIGLRLDEVGIAISLPPTSARGRTPTLSVPKSLAVLFPGVAHSVGLPSRRVDLAAFFVRQRARRWPDGVLMVDVRAGDDGELAALATALLAALSRDPATADLYADAICATLAARCAERPPAEAKARRRPCGQLPKWRLKRVMDYVDAHLDAPITLADMAAAARLTRMHFAAQFRAATGLRPHDYLQRQRIARAKILLEEDMPLVEVAVSVGFQTHAHFTTVFGRLVGEPPSRWRQARMAERRRMREARPRAEMHRPVASPEGFPAPA
ncbi:helix-turn-helix transcriptional regulator [Aquabacter sp. L1I39]|uniref:helix-turn-helix domain-containing protein n=1 Tax=Aquabacter sp. L1I39 TaxID=2820278 RepID=UPI001AD99C71|nr:AraC family transcriptional regulator [Aquabacter sp. L1I39]QTL04371.1 helix-turn-helix transcriptional regulator [Aquabacter sp. L1I39]